MSSSEDQENLQEQRDEVLALQSIYNTDDDEKLKIISEVNEDGHGTFSILVSICVKPVSEQIRISVVVPDDEDEEEQLGAAAMPEAQKDAPALSRNLKLNRSMSGRNWEGSFHVKYLSPLHLYITFPASYPSHNPPEYYLSCGWLSPSQIQLVSTVLGQLWQEASAMPIVFTWIDWLENNTLEHLGIIDHLALQNWKYEDSSMMKDGSPKEFLPWEEEIGDVVASLILFNRELVEIDFCQNEHLCEVCYDEKPGTQFFNLHECDHKFCHECMMAFCELHVTNGTVEELRCPDTECDSILPPHIVQAVLPPQAYGRWEKLLLKKTLDAMGDTVYCPRCQSLVIREAEEYLQLAVCTICYFAFCTECRMGWHQGSLCESDETKLENVEKKRSELSPAEQKKYDEMLKKIKEDIESKKALKKNTRNCPRCKIPVEKIGGCNKMTCKCGTSFCWLCGNAIKGYCHFRASSCALFPGQETNFEGEMARRAMPPNAVLRIRARVAVNPDLENNQVKCPNCKQVNLKANNNNHMKCWNCKRNFCFLCKTSIIGGISAHFTGPCVQHS